MSDQMIINYFYERSERAITALDEKYGALCKTIAKNILRNEQDAEECVNDAYLAAWNSIPPNTPNPLSSYICKITKNLAIKKYHHNTAQKRNHYYDMILDELGDSIAGSESVENEILVKELSNYLNMFLKKLKEKDRVIFVQRYWFCLSVPEIAELLGESSNYVNVKLHRTRRKLQKYIKMEGLIE